MNYLKNIILVVVLLAIGYFLLPYVKINPKNTSAPKDQSNNKNSGQTSGSSSGSTSSSAGTIKTYSSDKLGISFNYNEDQDGDGKADTTVKESDDKVYVYYTSQQPEQGQWVQQFSKDSADTLEQAVSKKFLNGISSQDCYATDMAKFYSQYGENLPAAPSNISKVIIAYPFPSDPNADYTQNAAKCPQTYSLTNGLNYFYMDSNHPDKFYFFNIGQYAIVSDSSGQTAWQDTVKVTK